MTVYRFLHNYTQFQQVIRIISRDFLFPQNIQHKVYFNLHKNSDKGFIIRS